MKKLPAILIIFILLLNTVAALSAISISKTSFESNDAQLNGEAWLVSFGLAGDQSFKGTIKAADIKDGEGRHAINDLTISASATKNSCNYDITTSADDDVHQYGYTKESVWGSSAYTNAISNCKAKGNDYATISIDRGLRLKWDVYCLTRDRIGVPATIRTPIENFEAELTVQVKDQIKTGKITSSSSKSVNLPPIAYATWQGSLSSGETCPNIASEGFMGVNTKDSRWILIRQSTYNAYASRLNNFIDAERTLQNLASSKTLTSADQPTVDAYINQINLLNSLASNVITSEIPYSTSQGVATVTGTQSAGKINLNLKRQLSNPLITMKVDADILGVFVPVGKPQIVSATTKSFTEGVNGNIEVIVKNIGEIPSTFSIGLTCEEPFSSSTTVRDTKLINPSEQTTINLPLTGQTEDAKSSAKCRVSAYDADKPQDAVFKDVIVTVTCQKLCNAGETRCTEDSKEACSDSGCKWETVTNDGSCKKACALDIDCNDGNDCTNDVCKSSACTYSLIDAVKCKEPIVFPPKKDDPCASLRNEIAGIPLTAKFLDFNWMDCKTKNSPLFIYFAVGIGIIAAVLIYYTTRKFFGNDNETKVLNAILSLVCGSLISLFFYNFAVYVIILVIVLLVIMMIVNAIF